MKRTIWHLLRAALMFLWLYTYYTNAYHASVTLVSTLVFAVIYGIALAVFPNISAKTRVRIAAILFPIVLVLMLLERAPWDYVPEYIALCLYLPELVVNQRSVKRKLIVIPTALTIAMLVAFFSLYRIGRVTTCPNATIDGHLVSCKIIKVLGEPDVTVVVANGDWKTVDIPRNIVEDVAWYKSMDLGGVELVDVRYRHGYPIKEGGILSWDPKLSYKNKRLSFYIEADKLLVCNGVDL